MTVKLRPAMISIIAGTLATAAVLITAPEASAGIVAASVVATSNDALSQTESASHSISEPCEYQEQSTILGDSTASLAALGSDSPLAQASVLIAGLGCLLGGSLLLKRHCH